MTRVIVFIATLLLPLAAQAQQSQPSPQIQALQQRIIRLEGELLDSEANVIALQRQVDDLKKQLPAKQEPPKP